MENKGMKFEFSAKSYQYSTSVEMSDYFKWLEEGWGRMKVTAKVGHSEWKTAIWFDRKQDTYLLPLKAVIRKQENIILDEDVKVTIWV